MKKYTLYLVILIFIISLLTVSVGVARAYECEPGHLFSIFTGQPCSTISSNNASFSDLKIGSRGERVRAFQQMLKDSGFLYGRVDGIYGRITDSAAKNYYRIYPPTPINTNAPVVHGVSGPQILDVNQEGTWTVTASDVVGGGSLSYTVTWGDEVYYYGSVSALQKPAQQSATFTHSYATAGTYNPTFTVTNKYGQSTKTSLSVVVGNVNPPTPTDNITVLSPNGGENWLLGNTESIRWSDSTPTLLCVNCGNIYDIKIQATCTTSMCTEIYRPFMLIAKGVRGTSYSWSVGSTLDFIGSVTNGAYKIQVCQSGTSNCDLSDRYFTISSKIVIQEAPTISYLSPTYGPVGTTVTITGSGFSATGNKIRFGNLGVENSPSYNNLSSSDGTHLTFTVPYSNYYACWDSYPACMIAARMTAPGIYAVSVINSSGKVSNELSFAVTQ
ncbi:IPT/TIG domain-containing protein [Candidatus Nomurabacteria bacterium]|nr:IPT/TIG domain-containing protein [Candidatus Nomurabacteria bacterium]